VKEGNVQVIAPDRKVTAAKRDAILADAQQTAKTMISSMIKEAAAQSEKDLNSAKRKASEIMEKAVSRAEGEVFIINEMVKEKEKSAIDLVLNNVI
jgi:vacuolar-type H+-ATPase subunit H